MKQNFDAILEKVFKHEGGYVDHPKDPGGATNMGITFATLQRWRGKPITKQDVRNLTKREAADIYRAYYWNVIKGDDLPSGIDAFIMDYGVNSGPSRAVIHLQEILKVGQDGKVGPITIEAARKANAASVVDQLSARRMRFLKGLSTWGTFGRGWERRVNEVTAFSKSLIRSDDNRAPTSIVDIIISILMALFRR